MGYVHEDFMGLAYDRDGYDSDFSRRLAKTSSDSLYDKDGLLDVSNINAPVTTSSFVNSGSVYAYKTPAAAGPVEINNRVVAPQATRAIGQTITLTTTVRNDFDWTLTTTVAIVAGDVVVTGTALGVYVATSMVLTVANGGGTTSVLTGTVIQLAAGLANADTGVAFLWAASIVPNRQADPRSGKF